jgi:hypothetical protein
VKALIVMGVAAAAVALGPVLNNAIGAIGVDSFDSQTAATAAAGSIARELSGS